jgi:hypothetical protein
MTTPLTLIPNITLFPCRSLDDLRRLRQQRLLAGQKPKAKPRSTSTSPTSRTPSIAKKKLQMAESLAKRLGLSVEEVLSSMS